MANNSFELAFLFTGLDLFSDFFACSQWQVTGVLLQLRPLTCTHKPNLAQECQSLLKDLRVTFSVERQRSAVADFAAALILFSSSLS